MRLKCLVAVTARSDLSLLRPLIEQLRENKKTFDVTVASFGASLSEFYNMSQAELALVDEQFVVDFRSDTSADLVNYLTEIMSKASVLLSKGKFDFVLMLGDRYELWGIAIPAVLHNVPIVHLNGGELTEGAVDDYVRHSVTKLASIHFPSIEQYAKRIIQMGEQPERVFVAGYIGLDSIKTQHLLSSAEMRSFLGFDPTDTATGIITYHPVTLDSEHNAAREMETVLSAAQGYLERWIVTLPGADKGSLHIVKTIERFCQMHPNKFIFIPHLGQQRYFSLMRYAKLMLGNSSSGILEAASFQLPVVNVGPRQQGRFKPKNVIDCSCKESDIRRAIETALSQDFRASIRELKNPYGDGGTARAIIETLRKIDFRASDFLKKRFFDIPFNLEDICAK